MGNFSSFSVVLCRPEGALNIGSVCRAMKNMGLSDLSIIGSPENFSYKDVSTMALAAIDIYDSARWFSDLPEALQDNVFSAGISRRRGPRRKLVSYLPEEFAEKTAAIAKGRIALVFGNERNGLTDNELTCCRAAVHIPSDPDFPSLNLSHAVQIMAYTLFRTKSEAARQYSPVCQSEIDRLALNIKETLGSLGLFDKEDQFGSEAFFRDILTRAHLCKEEAIHMAKIFTKVRYTGKKPGGSNR